MAFNSLHAWRIDVEFQDRRRTSRLPLQVPILLRWRNASEMREARTVSRDVSSHGVYFSLPETIKDGTTVEIEMTLPSQVALSAPSKVRCLGRVQRCEQEEGAKAGMAVSINKYEFIFRRGEAPSEKDLCLIPQD
jgi:hypothetical protein